MIPSLMKVIPQLCGRVLSFHLNVGKSPRHLTLHWKCHPKWDCNMLSSERKPYYQKHLLNNVPEKHVASSLFLWACIHDCIHGAIYIGRSDKNQSFLELSHFSLSGPLRVKESSALRVTFWLACLLYEVLRIEPTASHMLHSSPALNCAPSWRMLFMQIIKRSTAESFKELPARSLHFCDCCCSTDGDIYKRGTSATTPRLKF